MAKWRHENIVQIYYADDESGFYYYAMEYVDGHDLATILSFYAEDSELMPIPDIIRIGRSVAAALDYAHREGVIHRDVKPSNVMVARDGRVMLGDFGMALEIQGGSLGEAFGTPHYMSPEQARRSSDAIPQSDLYSLGVILYEILTGLVPFNDPSPASVALQHITQQPPLPRTINPELGIEVEAVLLKALEKDPRNRYQTGAQLMDALEQALSLTETDLKTPLPPIPVGVPTIRRSEVSLNSMTKRAGKRRTSLKTRVAQPHTSMSIPARFEPVSDAVKRKEGSGKGLRLLLGLIALIGIGMLAWFALSGQSLPFGVNRPVGNAALSPVASTKDNSQPVVLAKTATVVSVPQVTPTITVEAIVTQTSTPTLEPTATLIPSPTIPAEPTVKYPDGNHFTIFYNNSSLHILNRSRAIRSLDGFVFQRLDSQGQPQETFDGYLWEEYAKNLLPKYCVSIKIYDSTLPYIDPPDCKGKFLSFVQPKQDEDRAMIFWTPKAGSTQFRVLWLKEEVARCEIDAGICELYIP